MISVIVPAYNEGVTIERCLHSMLAGAKPGELQVIVVCNACRDDTAKRAKKFAERGVTVVETSTPGKANALNLGDEHAEHYPRFYVDADIEISVEALRDVARMLDEGSGVLVAAPRAVVDFKDRGRLVRSFYTVWTALPYFTEGVIGAGVYAFSKEGRERFDRFPDIIADDEYARLQVAPHERRCSARTTFTITPPTSLMGILNIKTRVRAGNYELRQRFPELAKNDNTTPARSLRVIATTPRLWTHAPIYLGVMFVARVRALRKLRQHREHEWERDESSRAQFGKGGA